MKIIELSNKQSKNGRRKFKAILHRIFPNDCVIDETGTQYNDNGITWLREYCEKALPTISGMSLRCEFVDPEDRVEILGHGETEIVDGMQLFENATVIGNFKSAEIVDMEVNGEMQTVCVAEGEIDEACYKSFVEKLDEDIAGGNAPYGSVEIYKTTDNEGIVYMYGYKDYGRIPMEFIYSGFALLGVRPADKSAKLLELNNKKEDSEMDEKMLQGFVSDIKQVISETNSKNEELSKTISELNEAIADKDKTISEINASADELKTALEKAQTDYQELWKKEDELYNEINKLKEQLAEAQAKERVGEMNSAISEFNEEEKSYAKEEIQAFEKDPVNCEINSIVTKILAGIGKKAKDAEKVVSEQNSAHDNEVDDIFAEVIEINSADENDSIF
jgi:uncharacterized coiled-coil protein SlyX